MPSNLLQADVGFPQFKDDQKPDEKITQVVNYLYMLLEQLRYSFGNLGSENFSESGIEELQTILTEPIYGRLENDEGLINELSINATGLYNRLYDQTTGDIVQLAATAQGLLGRMSDAEGNITTIGATANGLYTEVWGAEPGTDSRITQNANAITTKVSSGDVSTMISQFANGLVLSASNGSTSSTLTLSSGSTTLSSANVAITGMVRFDSFDLPAYSSSTYYYVGDQVTYGGYIYTCTTAGSNHTPSLTSSYWARSASSTFINGGSIQTGTVSADCVTTGTITSTTGTIKLKGYLAVQDSYGSTAGSLGYISTGQGNSGVGLVAGNYGGWVLAMSNGVKIGYYDGTQITAVANQLYFKLGTGKDMYLYGDALYPGTSGALSLGSSNSYWNNIYISGHIYQNGTQVL